MASTYEIVTKHGKVTIDNFSPPPTSPIQFSASFYQLLAELLLTPEDKPVLDNTKRSEKS